MRTVVSCTYLFCQSSSSCVHVSGCCSGVVTCSSSDDCPLTEACIGGACQHPCDAHNPCALNAVCINTNHGSDCSCAEGYQGNGFVGCAPGSVIFLCFFGKGYSCIRKAVYFASDTEESRQLWFAIITYFLVTLSM